MHFLGEFSFFPRGGLKLPGVEGFMKIIDAEMSRLRRRVPDDEPEFPLREMANVPEGAHN